MEEVDLILLSQLREIGCEMDQDINNLSQLDSCQIMKYVAICLQRILSDESNSVLVPSPQMISSNMNMSIKYKFSTQFVSCIKSLGYKSEIGYQVFLYSNEHEIRRLLLFLVEQISLDEDEPSAIDENDLEFSVHSLSKSQILKKLKNSDLNAVRIPRTSFFDKSFENNDTDPDLKYCKESDFHDVYQKDVNWNLVHSAFNLDFSIKSFLAESISKNLKRYINFKFCEKNKNSFLPINPIDILEWNNCYWKDNFLEESQDQIDIYDCFIAKCTNKKQNWITLNKMNSPIINVTSKTTEIVNSVDESKTELVSENLDNNVKLIKEKSLDELENKLNEYEKQIGLFKSSQNVLSQYEKEYQDKAKKLEATVKDKRELENGISHIKSQIEEIQSTWDEMQEHLIMKLKNEKSQWVAQNAEYQEKMKSISYMKKSISDKMKEIYLKENHVKELESKVPDQWPPGRGSYTKRIIEIINNVKKQNAETKKVFLETKSIQKDINSLNGKIERNFAVAEEVLYREAKQNEWNRRCYKSLVLLQSTFNEILQALSEIGLYLREIRQFEEMIENEKSQKICSNLLRINADLEQIRLENSQLKQKIENKVVA